MNLQSHLKPQLLQLELQDNNFEKCSLIIIISSIVVTMKL